MTRASEFRQSSPSGKQQKSDKWKSRSFLLRHDRYTKTNEEPSIFTYSTPGRGQNGESSN